MTSLLSSYKKKFHLMVVIKVTKENELQ